jgi:ABC-type glycerol-3-phosphate transport system substrate-binding protein
MVVQDFIYNMKVSPTPADTQGGANTINTGNAVMKYEGPWFLGQLNSPDLRKDNKQVEFDVVLMPKGGDDARPHRGWAEGVALLQGEKVEQGWAFASWAAGEEGQKIYSDATGRIPNNLALAESYWMPKTEETYQIKNARAFLTAFKSSYIDVVSKVPRSKMWLEVVKPTGWDPMTNNSAKAADVLPKVDAALQQLLDASK